MIDPEDDSLAIFGTSDNSRIAKITTGDDHGGGGAVGDPGAEMAEERVSVIDTATMTISAAIDGPDRPRALLVTNDGDAEDADELLVVPELYGEPTAEARDDGRTGGAFVSINEVTSRPRRPSPSRPSTAASSERGRRPARRSRRPPTSSGRSRRAAAASTSRRSRPRPRGRRASTTTSSRWSTSPTWRPAPRSPARAAPPTSREKC